MVGGESFGSVDSPRMKVYEASADQTMREESTTFKSSLLHLISSLISLAPHVVVQKLKDFQILPIICNGWTPQQLIMEVKGNPQNLEGNPQNLDQEKVAQLKFTQAILTMLSVIQTNDEEYSYVLLLQNDVLPKVLHTFHLCAHAGSSQMYIPVWNEAITLIGIIVECKDNESKDMCALIIRHLHYIAVSLLKTADVVKNDNSLIKKFLQLIFVTLKMTSPRQFDSIIVPDDLLAVLEKNSNMKDYFDNNQTNNISSSNDNGRDFTVGELLCVILMHLKSKFGSGKHSALITTTLAFVFTQSELATSLAHKAGFLETLIEEIKDILTRIKVTSCNDKKSMSKKKVLLIHDLCCTLSLTRDMCTFDNTIKEGFVDSHILHHMQSMWSLSSTDGLLRRSLLQLLVVLSSRCESAQRGICTTVVESTLCEEVSFLSHIVKLLMSLHESAAACGKFDECLPLCFDVLVNVCHHAPCGHLVIKSNLFNLFINVHALLGSPKKSQRNAGRKLITEWMKVLCVMTFNTDIAKAFGKVAGCTDVLMEIVKNGGLTKKLRGVTTLRNLLFVPVHKQTITSDAAILECVSAQLGSKSLPLRVAVASFFWAALYDNQKARVSLKKINLENRLCNNSTTTSESDDKTEGSCWSVENLGNIVEKVQTLLLKSDN